MAKLRWLLIAIAVAFVFVTLSASAIIDYAWWAEMEQLDTWYSMALYRYAPRFAAALLAFVVFRTAFTMGRRRARATAEVIDVDAPNYSGAYALIGLFSLMIGASTVSPWTIVQYFGGHSTANASSWRDPLFGEPLSYYLFDLPFYVQTVNGLMLLTFLATLIYFVSSIPFGDKQIRVEVTKPLRFLGAALLVFWAVRLYLGRYELLTSQHGFLTGADYVDEKIRLPLQWLAIVAMLSSGVLVAMGRYWMALPGPVIAALLRMVLPGIVGAVYVKPNEISLEKPYIERHIAATLSAYGLDKGTREIKFAARADAKIDFAKHRQVLENVRLWDWQAFRDTVSQVQPLRPYTYRDIDVDRYNINGMVRQVMVAPRELDIDQLGDARNQWVNPNFVYTHGYGLVMADSNKINSNGLPELYVQDAPPEVSTPSLKLTRPELYYGEITHEPVFVRTAQQEFDYPSGSDNVHTRYQGNRGIPISGLGMRLLAAAAYGNPNIVLTGYLTGDSRMLIHRNVGERLQTLAGFVDWDADPYLMMTKEGRLVWIADGYLTSSAHPYSQYISDGRFRSYNYIRNSVKATVDAYDGETNIYIVDPTDPVVRSYQNLFPKLFREGSAMPQEVREHLRFGEKMFESQAFIYRTYHMREAEAFYNKADLWDHSRYVQKQGAGALLMEPTFVLAALPGETQAEFLLVLPFSPRGKDNLIGYMAARNDPAHYGEIVFLQMPKQEVLLGPMQLEARIDQDQTISKDLNLWNQQGSQVLRGQTLVLPVDDTFLYVKPIYLQAANARMPQLKKVVLAMGGRIVYEDTYERALEVLAGGPAPQTRTEPTAAGASDEKPAVQEDVNTRILERLRRMRSELDALESEIRKR